MKLHRLYWILMTIGLAAWTFGCKKGGKGGGGDESVPGGGGETAADPGQGDNEEPPPETPSSELDQALPKTGIFASNAFSTTPLANRSEALAVAGTIVLAPGLNLIGGESGAKLWLTGTAYDLLETYTNTYDPSVSAVETARLALCTLEKIDYRSLPETEQTVTTDLKACFPKAQDAGAKMADTRGGSGGKEGGGNGGGGGGTQDTGDKPATVKFKSYVNTDRFLVIEFSFLKPAEQSWMQDLFVTVTVVAMKPVSAELPNGEFLLLMKGQGGDENGPEMLQVKLAVGGVPGAEAGLFAMLFTENDMQMWSFKRLAGYFKAQDGAVVSGKFLADIEGWDPQSGEPGGQFRVAFDAAHMRRERSIPVAKLAEYDRAAASEAPADTADTADSPTPTPSKEGETGPTEPGLALADTEEVKTAEQCFALGQYSHRVYGYRAFGADGGELAHRNGIEFTTADNTIHGWADYWGVNAYPWQPPVMDKDTDGDTAVADAPVAEAASSGEGIARSYITDGMTVYKFDWNKVNWETGTVDQDTSHPYTMHVKSGKLTKRTRVPVDMAKLDGKRFDWVWEQTETGGRQVRIEWRQADKAFYVVAVWDNDAGEKSWSAGWLDLPAADQTRFAFDYPLWSWSEAAGGSIIFRNECAGDPPVCSVSGTVEKEERVTESGDLDLRCLSNCFRPGLAASLYESQWSEGADWTTLQSQLYFDDVAGGIAYAFSGSTFALTTASAAVELTGTPSMEWTSLNFDGLIAASDLAALTAAHPEASAWELRDLATVTYRYEWGFGDWNKSIWLTDAGGRVTFDPPRNFEYTVLAADLRDDGDAAAVGKSYMLSLHYGYLNVPWESRGSITDPITNSSYENWAPAFALKDGVILTDAADGAKFKIKAEYTERRLKEVDAAACADLEFATALELPAKVNPLTGAELPKEALEGRIGDAPLPTLDSDISGGAEGSASNPAPAGDTAPL